jgi:hypothetical protein
MSERLCRSVKARTISVSKSLDGSATHVWIACPTVAVPTWATNVARQSSR